MISEPKLPEDIIRGQLTKVLASPEFAGRPVLRSFLSFVVEETLAGQSHQIKGYTVAVQVFGRKESFDGLKDPIVRIQAGRLRRALERYYSSYGSQDAVRIEIPKGSYVPKFHELSTAGTGKGGSLPQLGSAAITAPYGPSVAIMPLVNLTGDPGQEYFADGLTEELTQELARFQDFRVVASHSTIQMKGRRRAPGKWASGWGLGFWWREECARMPIL